MRVALIIPCRNEAGSIGPVVDRALAALPDCTVVVVDNGSSDRTADVARAAGADVVCEPRPGYGWACLAGVARALPQADALVFLDGDGSMAPEDAAHLIEPIRAGTADLVLGRRDRTTRGAMPWHQIVANRVIGLMLRGHGVRAAELGPYRAIRSDTLASLAMPGSRFAWPAEMLARAARTKARIVEVPVGYSERTAGHSKVGGSVRGTLAATWDIARALAPRRASTRR